MYPVLMEIGGSQLNAIELAHGAAERGHEVVLFGPRGPLVQLVDDLGLEYIHAPQEDRWPSPRNIATLVGLARRRRIDVVHAYEWGPSLELAFGPHALLGTPLVSTVMSMQVSGFLPDHAPLIVGTRDLADEQRRKRAIVELMEPPIDTTRNASAPDRSAARARFGFAAADTVLGVVCRLSTDLGKLDGVLDAIEVVGRVGAREPVRLLVVGEGAGLPLVSERAEAVNRRLGRPAVTVAGSMVDPRDAYDAADVILGMGSSALKGMAFAKPLVVLGEHGFSSLLDATTLPRFLQQGWWGTGTGDGAAALESAISGALTRRDDWDALGRLGRGVVEEKYSLSSAIEAQIAIYERAVAAPPARASVARSLAMTMMKFAKSEAATALERRDRAPGTAVVGTALPHGAAA